MFSPNKQDTKSPTGYIMSTSLMDEVLDDFFSDNEDSHSQSLTTQAGLTEEDKNIRKHTLHCIK